MKTIALLLMLVATPALAEDPASRPVNKVYGIYVDDAKGNTMAVPILIVIFGFPALVGLVAILLDYRQKKEREATLRLAIQTQNVPPELLALLTRGKNKPTEATRPLPQAVFLGCILAGVGFIPALDKHGIMLFFIFMGAGFILRAYLSQPQK